MSEVHLYLGSPRFGELVFARQLAKLYRACHLENTPSTRARQGLKNESTKKGWGGRVGVEAFLIKRLFTEQFESVPRK